MTERRLVPPDPPKAPAQCWWCNEDLYPDDRHILEIGGYATCDRDECAEAIGLELGLNEEYEDLDDDYTFADFCRDEAGEYKYIPTEEEMKMNEAEAKLEDMRLETERNA